MNIHYNSTLGRFEAEFTDFEGDLNAVKKCKFKTDGPPTWTWWTIKIESLNLLRGKHRPASGLNITEDAYRAYVPLAEMEAKNKEVKKALAKVKREPKQVDNYINPLTGYRDREDLPPAPPFEWSFKRPEPPALRCINCGVPVYKEYEKIEPWPICLYCEAQLESKDLQKTTS
jgi:hypothetical protein